MDEFTEPKKKFKLTRVLKLLLVGVLIVTFIVFWWVVIYFYFYMDDSGESDDQYTEEPIAEEEEIAEGDCNVYAIALHGVLMSYLPPESLDEEGKLIEDYASAEDIVRSIDGQESDPTTKAIILEIDSVGGGPVAAEEVANALKRSTKPTVALIREYGDSAAYYAATGADIIFASQNSDVGSIGVTSSYVDYAKQNTTEGLNYNQLSSGKYKDYGDPDKPLTAEERALLMRDLNIVHDNFVRAVAENRNLDIEKVKKLADGSSMPGKLALDNGLIDRIGDLHDVEAYLAEKLGEPTSICW